ncbi:SLY1 protein [Cyathus striatus]|nr:SLY1 protein [Cyathus striatus]
MATALKQPAASTTLQQSQTASLLNLLSLNQPVDSQITTTKQSTANVPALTGPPVWKVLVLDQQTKDVLATVLRVQDLRDVGVTLHVQLHSHRPEIPDVPAVYFVSPTLQNVRRIAQDLQKGLYESFHLNFVEPLPRALLEELAASVAQDGTGDLIEQVRRRPYLSFIAPSPSLFSLLPPPPPQASSSATPTPLPKHGPQIEEEIERVAAGLFSAVATLGHVPYIRAPRGNAAEMIAKKLETKIRDAIISASRSPHSSTSLFAQDSTGLSTLQRPLLLILDRNVDLVSMIAHGWTYQALVSDCLEMKLNRVTVPQPQGQSKKSYDLDAKDFFWARNAANPFPQVAEDIDTELNKYKQDAAEITRSTGVSDEAISKQTIASILELLRADRPDGNFTPGDKLRLVIVFYLSSADNVISKEDIAELEKELKSAGADIAAFEYVRRTREITRMSASVSMGGTGTATPNAGVQGGELFKGFSALGNRLTDRLKEGGFENLLSGVKNLLPTNKLLPVTRLVEALMDSSAASNASLQETDEYIFLDPRAPRHVQAPGTAGSSGVTRANVWHSRKEWYSWLGGCKSGKRVTYGGTEIVDPGGFLQILEELGGPGI